MRRASKRMKKRMKRMKMKNKKANLAIKKLITAVLVVLVIVIVIYGVYKLDFLDYLKNLPGFNGGNGPSEDLIVDAVIDGVEVKALLDDGYGRCHVYEVSDINLNFLKKYGIRADRLELFENGQWNDAENKAATDEQLRKRNLKDKLTEKKDNLVIEYKDEKYNMKLDFVDNWMKNGLVAEIDNAKYVYRGKNMDIYKSTSESFGIYEDSEMKDAFFRSLFDIEENGFDYNEEYLGLRFYYGFNDEDDDAIYSILYVIASNPESYASEYYGIDYKDRFYYKESAIEDWRRFEQTIKAYEYLYELSVFKQLERNRERKEDLIEACGRGENEK